MKKAIGAVLNLIRRIPGHLMLVPFLLGACFNTWFPSLLQIGSPLTSAFSSSGVMTLVGLSLFFSGAQIKLNNIGLVFRKGGYLILTKCVIGAVLTLLFGLIFGLDGVFGASLVAFGSCMMTLNPGTYTAAIIQYGDPDELSSFGLVTLFVSPAIPMCVIGLTSGLGFNWMVILATFIPLVAGVLLGNMDQKIADFVKPGISIIVPFMGFCLGAGLDFRILLDTSLPALFLVACIYTLVFMPVLLIDKKILKGRGHLSTAMTSIAGTGMTIPAMLAAESEIFAPYVQDAVGQAALCVILTSLITPFFMKLFISGRPETDPVTIAEPGDVALTEAIPASGSGGDPVSDVEIIHESGQ